MRYCPAIIHTAQQFGNPEHREVPLPTNTACIFCDIIAGKSEASIVFRDDLVTVFMDLYPVNPGHLLVIPNKHAASIEEVPDDVCGWMFLVGRRMAGALRGSELRCEGVNLFLADGAVAGQDVFHSHLHVIPRFQGNPGRIGVKADYSTAADRETLNLHAEAIRKSLASADKEK
jgi:histidine triad (HIT) family protein